MKEPFDLSYGLFAKAENDFRAPEIGIANEAPLETVVFHLQQRVEKLNRAFLTDSVSEVP